MAYSSGADSKINLSQGQSSLLPLSYSARVQREDCSSVLYIGYRISASDQVDPAQRDYSGLR